MLLVSLLNGGARSSSQNVLTWTLLSWKNVELIFSISPIFIKHLKKKLEGKHWHWITTKPENITTFQDYGRLQIKFCICIPTLVSDNCKKTTEEISLFLVFFYTPDALWIWPLFNNKPERHSAYLSASGGSFTPERSTLVRATAVAKNCLNDGCMVTSLLRRVYTTLDSTSSDRVWLQPRCSGVINWHTDKVTGLHIKQW